MSNYCKKIKSKHIKLFFCCLISIQLISSILMLFFKIENDYSIYYSQLTSDGNDYKTGFIYLNYFYFMFYYHKFLSIEIGLYLHIFLIDFLCYLIINDIYKTKEEFKFQWFLWNSLSILMFSYMFNTNVICLFGLYFYERYKEKWFSPLFLLFSFYKITTIIAFVILFLLDLLNEKRLRINLIPAFLVVLVIVIVSFFSTYVSFINSVEKTYNNFTGFNIFIMFQITHFIWYSFVIAIVLEAFELSLEKRKYVYRICYLIIFVNIIVICINFFLFVF